MGKFFCLGSGFREGSWVTDDENNNMCRIYRETIKGCLDRIQNHLFVRHVPFESPGKLVVGWCSRWGILDWLQIGDEEANGRKSEYSVKVKLEKPTCYGYQKQLSSLGARIRPLRILTWQLSGHSSRLVDNFRLGRLTRTSHAIRLWNNNIHKYKHRQKLCFVSAFSSQFSWSNLRSSSIVLQSF